MRLSCKLYLLHRISEPLVMLYSFNGECNRYLFIAAADNEPVFAFFQRKAARKWAVQDNREAIIVGDMYGIFRAAGNFDWNTGAAVTGIADKMTAVCRPDESERIVPLPD